MRTSVHNLRRESLKPSDIRIDRRTEFGNEFIIGRDGTRADVIAKLRSRNGSAWPIPGRPVRHGGRRSAQCMAVACSAGARRSHATETYSPAWLRNWSPTAIAQSRNATNRLL